MFNRRNFVIATGAGVLAATFGVEQAVNSPHTAAAAGADSIDNMVGMAGMATSTGPSTRSKFTYGSHAVELTQSHNIAALTIDGRPPIHLTRPELGTYYTHLLPFNVYDDPQVLVRDIVECTRRGLFII